MSITIQDVSGHPDVPSEASLDAWSRAALDDEAQGELTLRLVGADEAQDLNERYRGRQGPTNVLSFGAEQGLPLAGDEAPLGDVVVCAPLVFSEAREQGKAVEAHWAHLVIHGVLHLMGYDHESDDAAALMESRERQILATFGFPDPYTDR